MKLRQFTDILSESDDEAIAFFRKYGKNIFKDNKLLSVLIKEKWSKKKRYKLNILSWIILIDENCEDYGQRRCFTILPIYKHFQEYMYSCCAFFGNKRIPWEEWKDLAKEQVDLLKILVKENTLEKFKDDKRYHAFCNKYEQREEELVKKGYDQLWDGEYT